MDYFEAFRNYATFTGRTGRQSYWMFVLIFQFIPYLTLFILDIDLLFFVYVLIILLPSMAINVRRLHDIGKSGWWYLINFIPFIGPLVMIYFLVQPSTPGRNQYGDPVGQGNSGTTQNVSTSNGVDKGLENYITLARGEGKTDAEIRETLLKNNWKEEDIQKALGSGSISSVSTTV